MSTINPYAAPSTVSTIAAQPETSAVDWVHVLRTLVRWFLICTISAGPSFMLGLVFGGTPERIAGMMIGVVMFILAYTYADIVYIQPRTRGSRRLKNALRIGYGTRVAISFVPPVAGFIDIPSGLVSVWLVNCLPALGGALDGGQGEPIGAGIVFLATLLTTLCQGVLLNLALGLFTAVVYLILRCDPPVETVRITQSADG